MFPNWFCTHKIYPYLLTIINYGKDGTGYVLLLLSVIFNANGIKSEFLFNVTLGPSSSTLFTFKQCARHIPVNLERAHIPPCACHNILACHTIAHASPPLMVSLSLPPCPLRLPNNPLSLEIEHCTHFFQEAFLIILLVLSQYTGHIFSSYVYKKF